VNGETLTQQQQQQQADAEPTVVQIVREIVPWRFSSSGLGAQARRQEMKWGGAFCEKMENRGCFL